MAVKTAVEAQDITVLKASKGKIEKDMSTLYVLWRSERSLYIKKIEETKAHYFVQLHRCIGRRNENEPRLA